jgi:hypothetical protein
MAARLEDARHWHWDIEGGSASFQVFAPGALVRIAVEWCQPRELVFVASDVNRVRGLFLGP